MNTLDIIIVGSGVSGASFARYCAKNGLKALVLEREREAGGAFRSHRFPQTDDFWIELGAHTCYNSYGHLIGVLEDCQMLGKLLPRAKVGFKFLIDNQVKSVPSQLNFFELALHAPRIFTLKKPGRSVEAYYSAIAGKKNFADVLAPAFNAVMCQRANDMPSDMLFKPRPRRKDVLRSYTFPEGVQSVARAAVAHPNVTFCAGVEARAIEKTATGFSVSASDGGVHSARFLALATPASAAAELLKSAVPSVARALTAIKVERIETVGVAVKKDAVALPPVAGLIARDDGFYSVVSRDILPHDRFRGFAFHFKPGVLDETGKLRRIGEVLGVSPAALDLVEFRTNLLPAPAVGHDSLVASLDAELKGTTLFLTGNYFGGVSIEDCVARSAVEFARLKSQLGRN